MEQHERVARYETGAETDAVPGVRLLADDQTNKRLAKVTVDFSSCLLLLLWGNPECPFSTGSASFIPYLNVFGEAVGDLVHTNLVPRCAVYVCLQPALAWTGVWLDKHGARGTSAGWESKKSLHVTGNILMYAQRARQRMSCRYRLSCIDAQ